MTSITLDPTACFPTSPSAVAIRPEVHLTRRGRAVVFLVALALVLAAAFWLFGATSAATEHGQVTRTVVVGSGETLWDIAADVAPEGRTGDTVARIQRLNHLDSGMVLAGQRLLVPVGS